MPHPMIYIKTSSADSVVTISLDHIGARVYISQSVKTKFLNVVIKFRTATSTVKQNLVLNSINPVSLCKSGCHPRELVNLEAVLKNAGIDTTVPQLESSQQSPTQRSKQQSIFSNRQFNSNSEHENKNFINSQGDVDVADDNDYNNTEEEYDYHGDNDRNDNDYDDSEMILENSDSDSKRHLSHLQIPSRSKRVKKDSDIFSSTPSSSKKKNGDDDIDKERRGRRKEKRKNNKKKTNNNETQIISNSEFTNSPSKSQINPINAMESFLMLKHGSPPMIDDNFSNTSLTSTLLVDECNQMKGYYRLTCLYDTVLKGIPSNVPHRFASSFDEPRLPDTSSISLLNNGDNNNNNHNSNQSSSVLYYHHNHKHLLLLLLLHFVIKFCGECF